MFDFILWNDVHTLRDAPAELNLGFEWNTWNHDVMKWFSTFLSFSSSSDTQQHASGSDGMHQASLQVGSKRPKLKVHRAYTHSRQEGIVEVPMVTEFPSQLISPVSAVRSVDSEILFSQGTISRPLDEMVVQISGENDTKNGIVDRRCQAYVKSKGRQCLRMAMRNDIYCYAHCSIKQEKCVKVITPICGGTTIGGSRCKNHSGSDGLNQVCLPVGSKRPKLKVHRAYTHSRQEGTVEVPMVTEFPNQLISPVSETVVQSVDSEILFSKGTISRPLNETVVQVSVEQDTKDGIVERRCQAYVNSMGRQCLRMAIRNNIYCCAHFSIKKEKCVKVLTPICGGTTIAGSRCKNHSLPNLSFCRKHLPNVYRNKPSNSNCSTLKRKSEETCSRSKIRICNDSILVHSRIPLEIDTKMVIDDEDESFCLFRCYACALCFESFTHKKLLESHVLKEHPVNFGEHLFLLKCIPCGDQFGTMEKLRLHVKSVHPAELKLSKYSLKMIEKANEMGETSMHQSHVNEKSTIASDPASVVMEQD